MDFCRTDNPLQPWQALQNKRRLDEAIAEYQKAIELDLKFSMAHNNLNSLRVKGRLGETIAEFKKALELDPKNGPARSNLAHWEPIAALLRKLPGPRQKLLANTSLLAPRGGIECCW